MGGCVGTQRGNGGRGSRRPSAFSDSTSSGLHGGTATKNRPLRHEKIRWKSDIPLTDGQLKSKRDEFWDTAPAFEGKVEIWNALKAAAEAAESDDFDLAQAILDGAGISLPNGSLVSVCHFPSQKALKYFVKLTWFYQALFDKFSFSGRML